MALTAFLAAWGLHLVAAASPGPAILMSARLAVTEGFRVSVWLAIGIAFGAGVKHARLGRCAERGDEPEVNRVLRFRPTRDGNNVVKIDSTKRGLRACDFDRGAKTAKHRQLITCHVVDRNG